MIPCDNDLVLMRKAGKPLSSARDFHERTSASQISSVDKHVPVWDVHLDGIVVGVGNSYDSHRATIL